MDLLKKVNDELLFKERRVSYWERYGVIPSRDDILDFDLREEEV